MQRAQVLLCDQWCLFKHMRQNSYPASSSFSSGCYVCSIAPAGETTAHRVQNSMCSQNIHCSCCAGKAKRLSAGFWGEDAELFLPLPPFPPPPPSFLFPLFISVTGDCFPSRAWGLIADLPAMGAVSI